MLKTKLAPYVTYAKHKGLLAKYLAVAARKRDPEAFVTAIAKVARAKGMARIAKDSGLGRESLYKALAPEAKPRYETVRKLVEAFGLQLTVQTRVKKARPRLPLRAASRTDGRSRRLHPRAR